MLKSSHILFTAVLCSSLLFGCGKQIPKDVIDPDKMEDILYDYHLAKVMGNELPYDQSYKKELYTKYVFDKYDITSAQFDSSMLWYSKHADMLAKIYVKIDKRYSKMGTQMESASANVQKKRRRGLSGDSLEIWNKSALYWLTPAEITNKMTFNIIADTSFRKNDIYIFSGDYIFLKGGKQNAVMAMDIILDNDSVIGRTQNITSSGHYDMYFSAGNSEHKIRSVNGFIYYNGDGKLPGVLANNLSLIKIHKKESAPAASDTTKVENSNQSETIEVQSVDTVAGNTNTVNQTQQVVTSVDTTDKVQTQPLRNDPRSIRERSPKKFRPKTN